MIITIYNHYDKYDDNAIMSISGTIVKIIVIVKITFEIISIMII